MRHLFPEIPGRVKLRIGRILKKGFGEGLTCPCGPGTIKLGEGFAARVMLIEVTALGIDWPFRAVDLNGRHLAPALKRALAQGH